VRDFALAADGSGDLYAAGDFSSYDDTLSSMILRINADGTADPGFSTGTGFQGPLAPPGVVYSVAVATDGSGDVYAGGNFISYNGTSRVNLARINADGSLDTGFAVGTGFDGIVRAVAAATDGSGDVYVGGDFANYNGTAAPRIIRLNPDGTVDAGFDVGTGTAGAVHCLEVAADGSGDVYAGGSIPTYRGNASKNLVRINSDGSYDPGFAVGTGFDFIVRSIQNAADASGDLYAAGIFTTYNGSGVNRITRLNSDGSRDLGFAVGTGLNAEVHKVRVAADGSGDALAAGFFTSYDGMAANQVVRINSDGSRDAQLDPGTGVQGRIANDRTIYALAVAADGSGDAWIGGPFTVYNGTGQNRFIRLNADGTVDVTSPQGSAFTGSILTIARTEDGSNDLYVGGGFTIYQGALITRIIRLNADGTPDPAFVVGTGFNNTVDVILPSVDGSGDLYVAGGFSSYQGVSANGIVRLNSDGSRDNGFALGTGFNGNVNALAFAPDGSGDLYVGGSFSSYQGVSANSIVRLNSDGSRDNGFAIGTAFGSGLVMTLAPLIDGSGDLYVGGGFTTYQGSAHTRIVRLNSDGSVEPSFNAGSGFDWTVNGVTLSLDLSGSLYVVGGFLNYQGVSAKALIRLLPSGARDPAFDVGTGFAFGTASNLAVPARDASGDVYVGGTFTDYQGTPVNRIVRLNPDGSIDPGFSVGNGCDIDVNEILPAGDATGTIYAGGAFTRYRTSTRSQFMRVGADGILH
jgi:uncharacterized delta-60 repeat protein